MRILLVAVGFWLGGCSPAGDTTVDKDKTAELVAQIRDLKTSELNRMRYLNAWLATSMSLIATRAPTSANDSLQLLEGSCGNKANVFADVAKALGYETRRISFFSVPIQLGHTAIEVMIEDEWIFFDPFIGVYFTDLENRPLSIAAARKFYPEIKIQRADIDLFRGVWSKQQKFAYQNHASNTIQNPRLYEDIIDIKRTYFASSTSGGEVQSHYFTDIPISVSIDTEIQLGDVDDSGVDLASGLNPDLRLQGKHLYLPMLERIGQYGATYAGRKFAFDSEEPLRGQLELHTVALSLEDLDKLRIDIDHLNGDYSVRHNEIKVDVHDNKVTLSFTILPPTSYLRLWSENSSIYVDAYRIKAFALSSELVLH